MIKTEFGWVPDKTELAPQTKASRNYYGKQLLSFAGQDYSKEYIRYAIIKGRAERKDTSKRPLKCAPLTDMEIAGLYQFLKGK